MGGKRAEGACQDCGALHVLLHGSSGREAHGSWHRLVCWLVGAGAHHSVLCRRTVWAAPHAPHTKHVRAHEACPHPTLTPQDDPGSAGALGGLSGEGGGGEAVLRRQRSNYHLTNGHAALELFLRLSRARQTLDFSKRQVRRWGTRAGLGACGVLVTRGAGHMGPGEVLQLGRCLLGCCMPACLPSRTTTLPCTAPARAHAQCSALLNPAAHRPRLGRPPPLPSWTTEPWAYGRRWAC